MEKASIIEMLVQAGAVGLCFYSLFVLKKLVGNHINHNTDALNRLEVAITKLITFLENKE
jgi:hypothetical protein